MRAHTNARAPAARLDLESRGRLNRALCAQQGGEQGGCYSEPSYWSSAALLHGLPPWSPPSATAQRCDAIEFKQRNHQTTPTCPPIQLPAEQPRIWLHRSQGPGGLALQYLCLVAHAETSLDDRHVQGSQLNQRLQRHFPHGRLSRAVWAMSALELYTVVCFRKEWS